jgi:hypothetical protein
VVYQGFFCCWGSWKSFNERCTLVLRNIYTKCSKSIRSNSYECSGWIILNPKTCWQTFITVSLARFQRFAISFVITNFRPLSFFFEYSSYWNTLYMTPEKWMNEKCACTLTIRQCVSESRPAAQA